MADKTAKRIAELIKPLRVKSGAKVNLARDFNPGYTTGFVKKKDGRQLLRTGIALLADHQRRLAAPDTYRVLVYRPAVEAGAARQALAGRR
ncbi:MAG TPA: hypothetical protein VIJ82_24835 [Streptosporangiaceae bacterium]|jgi:hypothetical protein